MAIKNLLFDLGAVVLNLDQEKTLRAFIKLGADLDEMNMQGNLFTDFEIGKISAELFVQTLHTQIKGNASKEDIVHAWNSMLLDFPPARVEMLRQLKKKYRLFLLSNTNSIHIDALYEEHGKEIFEELFEKIYLSHEIGHRKPNVDCYHYALNDAQLKGSETLFIDDNKGNLKGAEKAGINTLWAHEPIDNWFLTELKKINLLHIN
ncbi:MAG: HAD family phosphatase [bacterium]|nr:HAD family phosphatase [bacterium]